jgi:hypothetical protein
LQKIFPVTLINEADYLLARKNFVPIQKIKHVTLCAEVKIAEHPICLSRKVAEALQLDTIEIRKLMIDGESQKLQIVGPLRLQFQNKTTIRSAMIVPWIEGIILHPSVFMDGYIKLIGIRF